MPVTRFCTDCTCTSVARCADCTCTSVARWADCNFENRVDSSSFPFCAASAVFFHVVPDFFLASSYKDLLLIHIVFYHFLITKLFNTAIKKNCIANSYVYMLNVDTYIRYCALLLVTIASIHALKQRTLGSMQSTMQRYTELFNKLLYMQLFAFQDLSIPRIQYILITIFFTYQTPFLIISKLIL